jgi:hypothetical protein
MRCSLLSSMFSYDACMVFILRPDSLWFVLCRRSSRFPIRIRMCRLPQLLFKPPGKETSGSWAKMEYASPRARVFSLQKWAKATRNERPWRPAALSAATNPAPLHGRATPSALWTTNGHVHRRCALQLMPPLLLRVRLPPPEHPLLRSSSAPPPPSPPSAVEW